MWGSKNNTRNYSSNGQSSERFLSAKLSCSKVYSVETLFQNGNSLEQIAGFTVVARYRRDFLPKPC